MKRLYRERLHDFPTGQDKVIRFVERLNKDYGWNLVCKDKRKGTKEFCIPSSITSRGKFRFDGADLDKLIFFEYNGPDHHAQSHYLVYDRLKKEAIIALLRREKLHGKYVVYDLLTDTLTIQNIP